MHVTWTIAKPEFRVAWRPTGTETWTFNDEYLTEACSPEHACSHTATGLEAEKAYEVKLAIWALNDNGTHRNVGPTRTFQEVAFTTPPDPPTITTLSASAPSGTTATLNATVNPNGDAVSDCHFEYGPTASYGTSVPCAFSPGSVETPVAVSAAISGLAEDSTYHYRISATNAGGLSQGADETLTTLSSAPEFGRCVKVSPEVVGKTTVYKGGYTAATCLLSSPTHTGKYEWYSRVSKAGFTTTGAAVKLETLTKEKVVCASEEGSGSIVTAKSVGNVTLKLKGCELTVGKTKAKCATTGLGEGELEARELEGVLGFEIKASMKVGLDLYPIGKTGRFMEFSCNGSAIALTGSVIGSITANRMSTTATLGFKAIEGLQKPQAFEGGSPDVLLRSLNGGSTQQDGLTLGATVTYEELVEVNAVF